MIDRLEKIVSAPAIALDRTVDTSKSIFIIIKNRLSLEVSKILHL